MQSIDLFVWAINAWNMVGGEKDHRLLVILHSWTFDDNTDASSTYQQMITVRHHG